MQKTFEGPDSGVGASYAWKGNNKVGEGKQTIIRSQPHRVIEIDLQFVRPFASRNCVEFTFEPAGKETEVVWSMVGPQNFMAKLFGLVMNMDKVIGNDFEKGLASLQQLVERPAA
jgi:hypothetical protein